MAIHFLRKIDSNGLFLEDCPFWDDGEILAHDGKPKLDGDIQVLDENGNLVWEQEPILYVPPSQFPSDMIPIPVPEGFNHPKWDGGKWVEGKDINILLENARKTQIELISNSCQSICYSGFESSALGDIHNYPSSTIDQSNLSSAVLSAMVKKQQVKDLLSVILPTMYSKWTTPFWCADGNGDWAYVPHTANEIIQVSKDYQAFILANVDKKHLLEDQIKNSNSIEEIMAISWV